MCALKGQCEQCGSPYQETAGQDGFCDFCGMPLPVAPGGSSETIAALHRRLEECAPREDWHGAVQILEQLIKATEDPHRLARYHHALGCIHLEKRLDWRAGLRSFKRSLALEPDYLAAFNSLARTLVEQERWTELERAYMAVIEAVGRAEAERDQPVLSLLWKGLAALYREHLDDPDAAELCQERSEELGD